VAIDRLRAEFELFGTARVAPPGGGPLPGPARRVPQQGV